MEHPVRRRRSEPRRFHITVNLSYTANTSGTTGDVAEEALKCDRSVREALKGRGAQEIDVTVSYVELEDG